MRRTITYMIDADGAVYAQVGTRVAFNVLDFEHMRPENGFEMLFNIQDDLAFHVIPCTREPRRWTRKIPIQIKNAFRKHFGMKPLKEKNYGTA